jgi:hypothetical protein
VKPNGPVRGCVAGAAPGLGQRSRVGPSGMHPALMASQHPSPEGLLEAHPETGVSAIPRVATPLFPTQEFPNGPFLDGPLASIHVGHAQAVVLHVWDSAFSSSERHMVV